MHTSRRASSTRLSDSGRFLLVVVCLCPSSSKDSYLEMLTTYNNANQSINQSINQSFLSQRKQKDSTNSTAIVVTLDWHWLLLPFW